MRPLFRRLLGGVAIAAALYSCASVGRIEGGPYDETPPRFISGTPTPGALHHNKNKLSIEFDEFIKLDKPNEKIVISPPQVQQPEVKSNGKKVVITLQDTLKPNTTYTFDFGDAIQDNNEGNPLENFFYSFSTGDRLDSMAVAGTVLNAANLEPVKGMLVGLHANLTDSAFTKLPFERVGRTDSRGRFSIRGVAPGKYRIYALQDADQNFTYSQPTEFLAVDVYAPSAIDVYDYLTLSFTEPVASIDTAAFHLKQKVDSLWQDIPFDFMRDSLDLKRYNLFAEWVPGESYTFEVDSAAIRGLYGLFSDKIKKDFKAKKLEEYGQIFFNVHGADSLAFVELLDGQDKVLRTVPVVDGKADFYFLNPGKYGARLINDTNGNGVWDTGNYAEKRQPEMVYYYPMVLELKANFDLTQEWNIKAKSLDRQKPDELKKQKPDEDKKKQNRNKNNRSGNSSRNSGRGYSY